MTKPKRIYVDCDIKAKLLDLASTEFGGDVSACVSHLVAAHVLATANAKSFLSELNAMRPADQGVDPEYPEGILVNPDGTCTPTRSFVVTNEDGTYLSTGYPEVICNCPEHAAGRGLQSEICLYDHEPRNYGAY